jgi:hypothetical protein
VHGHRPGGGLPLPQNLFGKMRIEKEVNFKNTINEKLFKVIRMNSYVATVLRRYMKAF